MFRPCRRLWSRHAPSKAVSWQRPLTRVPFLTQHGLHDALAEASPIGSGSVDHYKSPNERHFDSLSPLIRSLKVSQGRLRRKVLPKRYSSYHFFADLSDLLAREEISGTTLWLFVQRSSPQVSFSTTDEPSTGDTLSDWQWSLLSQVLRRVLDEWASQEITSASLQPLTVLRHYVKFNFLRPVDWVYCLGFLAKTVYQDINIYEGHPLQTTLPSRIGDALRLRILCNVWRLFLIGNSHSVSGAGSSASNYENLWPQLRDTYSQVRDVENEGDFIQRFVGGIHKLYNIDDPNLDRQLAYSSILTLVAVYQNLRVSSVDKIDAHKTKAGEFPDGLCSSGGEEESPKPLPNWHLGSGQSTYWTPEIGHLSVSEASILFMVARAAENATLNVTLLRVLLSQMSLPDGDVQEIAKIYQGFKLAVPAILTKFQNFVYNRDVYEDGLLRRHPLRAYLKSVLASNNVDALGYAGAVAQSFTGVIKTAPGNALDLVRACLQMDRPERATRYWDMLVGSDRVRIHAWQIWLDYAFKQNDLVAFETMWMKLSADRVRRSPKMWYQRLLLLHQNNEPVVAWDRFCSLVRFSGQNRKLIGTWKPYIAPQNVDSEMFHMMIRSYLEKATSHTLGIVKAEETLELMKQQDEVEVTRETYMLFVQHFLKRGARESAVDWFLKGSSSNIKFLLGDYALLFEYDLVTHDQNKQHQLANPFANICQCFDAVSNTIRLIRGSRLYIGLDYQFPGSRLVSAIQDMPLVDTMDDDLRDPKMKEIQTIYAGIIEHLARNFTEQAYDASKLARLRLLLLLWDHCVMTGIPASTKMKSILSSTIYGLHPDLQEKLLRGAMFKNYNVQDPVSFHSYRFLRVIGSQWFAERVSSIPPGPVKSQLATIRWNGYNAVNDKALIDAGISSQEDRRKILDEIIMWENEAVEKRRAAATKKEERKKELSERAARFKDQSERYNDMVQEFSLRQRQQAKQINDKERILKQLVDRVNKRRTQFQAVVKDLAVGRSTMVMWRNTAAERATTTFSWRLLRTRLRSLRQSTPGRYSLRASMFRQRHIQTLKRSSRWSTPVQSILRAMATKYLQRSVRRKTARGEASTNKKAGENPRKAQRRRFWRVRRRDTSAAERGLGRRKGARRQLQLHEVSSTRWVYKVSRVSWRSGRQT